jgi:phosphatidylserine synthase
MLLIVSGIGFDGLDGWLHRRSGLPGSRFGRTADSVADAVTFGAAPAVLVAFHPYHAHLWAPIALETLLAAGIVLVLAVARLVWFTLRAYAHPHFVGIPTPQNALAVVVILLLFAQPAFLGTQPALVAGLVALVALGMVVPIRFPKMRRGSVLRGPMTVTGVALVAALLPLQFAPGAGSLLFDGAFVATILAAAGIALYYVAGPLAVRREMAKESSP